MLKKLFAAFSYVGRFDGWGIAQLSARIRADYFYGGNDGKWDIGNEIYAEVKKQKKDFAVIQAEDERSGIEVNMFLMKPTKQEEKIPASVCTKLGTLRFGVENGQFRHVPAEKLGAAKIQTGQADVVIAGGVKAFSDCYAGRSGAHSTVRAYGQAGQVFLKK